VLAATVAELDADDDEAARSEVVTPAVVAGPGRLEQHHAAAVDVQHAGQSAVEPPGGGGCRE
jgi:hypothetical protein